MRSFQIIFFCGVIVFLLNFPRVVMFVGQSVPFLYWGAIALILGVSFNNIVIKTDTRKDKDPGGSRAHGSGPQEK